MSATAALFMAHRTLWQVVSLNEMLNFCFLDTNLGLNQDENVLITQEQVQVLADLCHDDEASWYDNDVKDQVPTLPASIVR